MSTNAQYRLIFLGTVALLINSAPCISAVILDDNFDELRPGMLSAGVIGAAAEYRLLGSRGRRAEPLVSARPKGQNLRGHCRQACG